jgi:hypothetical protein
MDDTYDNSFKEKTADDFESKIGAAWLHGREYMETIKQLYVLKAVSLASKGVAEAFSLCIILILAFSSFLMLAAAAGFWIHASWGWSYQASFAATGVILFFLSTTLMALKKLILVSPIQNRIIARLLHHENNFTHPIVNTTDENDRHT